MIQITRTTSEDLDFRTLVMQLDKELWQRYPDIQSQYDVHNKIEQNNMIVVAYDGDIPVGCGCLKAYAPDTVEIKRMFVDPYHRGKGIGVQIMNELCLLADELGLKKVILETGLRQPEAIRLYQKCGFTSINNYPPYVGMTESVCMEKILSSPDR